MLCGTSGPSRKLEALCDLCDAIAAASAHALSAEELMPLVTYFLADALTHRVADDLLCHLAIAEAGMSTLDAARKAGYCLTTLKAAVEVIIGADIERTVERASSQLMDEPQAGGCVAC